LCQQKREAWAQRMREVGELPKPTEPEPREESAQGKLW